LAPLAIADMQARAYYLCDLLCQEYLWSYS